MSHPIKANVTRHRVANNPRRDHDRLVSHVENVRTPPTPTEAARKLGIPTQDVWLLIAEDSRLDVIDHGRTKLIVLADDEGITWQVR